MQSGEEEITFRADTDLDNPHSRKPITPKENFINQVLQYQKSRLRLSLSPDGDSMGATWKCFQWILGVMRGFDLDLAIIGLYHLMLEVR
jgi:hypothetical protein